MQIRKSVKLKWRKFSTEENHKIYCSEKNSIADKHFQQQLLAYGNKHVL